MHTYMAVVIDNHLPDPVHIPSESESGVTEHVMVITSQLGRSVRKMLLYPLINYWHPCNLAFTSEALYLLLFKGVHFHGDLVKT